MPLQLRLVLLVALGGCLGAPARYVVGEWGADIAPWATFVINIVGALALGVLLESLARRGPDEGRRKQIRLLLGTGFLGSFTTYSSLAVDTDLLIRGQNTLTALAYAASSVVVGLLAVVAGIAIAAALTDKSAAS